MRKHPLLFFFVLANLLSWLAWAPLTATGLGLTNERFSPYLHLLGGLGPLVAAVIVTAVADGKVGLLRLARSSWSGRGKLSWVIFAVAAPLLLFAISAAALAALGLSQSAWANVGTTPEFPQLPRVAFWVSNIIFYGFGEEVGWRGFALPRVQTRRTALTSAVLIGLAWSAWHIPLFTFSPGLSSMGFAGVAGWMFSILTGSILMTWLFNVSRGSVLAVALFHGVLDIVMTSPVKGALPSVMGAMITLCGVAAIVVFGKTNLARTKRVQHHGTLPAHKPRPG